MRTTINIIVVVLTCLVANAAVSNATPPTRRDLERAEDAAERAALEKYKGEEVSVSFYGKVLDQYSNPVEGAEVKIGMEHYDPKSEWRHGTRTLLVKTDSMGLFSLENERGWFVSVNSISKNGYEFVFSQNPNHGYEYRSSYTDRHIPDKSNPVIFHLRKIGPTTFLLEGPDLITTVAVRPDGNVVVVEFSKDPNYYWPDDRKQCQAFPGFAVSASLSKDKRDWVLTFKGKHEDDSVLLLDHIVYEAPEQGYEPSAELKISLQKNPVPGRGPTYPHEINACLLVRTAKSQTFARVGLQIYPRQEEKCDINYKITVNPYGERGFEYASEIDKHLDVQDFLRKQAVHSLCHGELPPKPDIPQLIQEAKEKAAKKSVGK